MWRRPVSRIMILYMDNFLLSCSFATKYFLCMVVKKNIFFWRKILFHQLSHMYLRYSYLMILNEVVMKACKRYYQCSGFLTSMKEQYQAVNVFNTLQRKQESCKAGIQGFTIKVVTVAGIHRTLELQKKFELYVHNTFLRIEKAKVHLCGTKVSANSVIHGHMKCIKFDWRKIPLEMQRFVHLEVPLHFLIIRTESLRERSRFHQNYRISPWWIPLSEVPKFKYVWIQEQYFERKTHLTPI